MSRSTVELRVDLDAIAAAQGVCLSDALQALRALYDDTDQRNARNTKGMDLPCKSGCSACCEEMVFLTPLEFYGAWDYFQKSAADDVIDRAIDDGLSIYAKFKKQLDAFEEPPPEGEVDHTSIAVGIAFRCPLLSDDGNCRIYPMREILGRLFGCSFNDDRGIYGCDLSGSFFADKVVTLTRARDTATQVHQLPLAKKQQAYPWYIHQLYGDVVTSQ